MRSPAAALVAAAGLDAHRAHRHLGTVVLFESHGVARTSDAQGLGTARTAP